jgi:3-deoxy-D-arabino-heptulosonate 7-phosphate (DAHP) synthase
MSLAAVAAGADGIIVEVHYKPQEALCDADQALTPVIFEDMMRRLRPLHSFMDQLQS